MNVTDVLVEQLRRTREWTLLLLEGIEGTDWTYQPKPGVQHALWICGHLAVAQEALVFVRCLNKSVLDPAFKTHFPTGGDIKSAPQYDWPDPRVVRSKMDEMQRITESEVASLSEGLLAQPAFAADGKPHPHYTNKLGAISHAARHEAFHAGQLALIRRLLGKKFLR
jgi:hypothetical protein